MKIWLLRRLATSLVLLLLLLSAVFFIVRLAPGDPLDQITVSEMGAADRELVRDRLGLNGGLGMQYLRWAGGVLRGDFGRSLRQDRPVSEILAEAVPPTLLLTCSGYALHLLLALAAALVMVARRGRWPDRLCQGTGLALYSVPGFWLGLMLILLLSRKLGWLPAGGMSASDADLMGWLPRQMDLLRHLVLPMLTLALGSFMGTARYLRAGLEEVLGRDYILAARSRGIPESRILLRHALRNALLPVVTLVGLSLPFLLGGTVVVESVFAWPGMGRVTIEAIWARDYPVIMATSVIAGVTVVIGSLLADFLYSWADPRIRLTVDRERRR